VSKPPRNLLIPFRRDQKNDFASGTGEELERSKVTQVLATEGATPRSSGELPWRTKFGSALHLLRHQRNEEALGELARVYVRDAFRRWVPEAKLIKVIVARVGSASFLRVCFQSARRQSSAGNIKLSASDVVSLKIQ